MKGDVRALSRSRGVEKNDVLVPQPVFAEIAYGIARLPRSKRKESLRHGFDLVKSELVRAEWTDAVSEASGEIKAQLERKGTRIEDFDAAIAAHAQAREATLVTANVEQRIRLPSLRVEDWGKWRPIARSLNERSAVAPQIVSLDEERVLIPVEQRYDPTTVAEVVARLGKLDIALPDALARAAIESVTPDAV